MNNSTLEHIWELNRIIILSLFVFTLSGCTYANNVPRETAQAMPTNTPYQVITPKPTDSTPKPTAQISSTACIPYVGMYVPTPPHRWEWHGTETIKDKAGNKISTTKYRYDTENNSYTIWVNKKDVVVKVNASRDSTTSPSPSKKKKPVPTPNLHGFHDPEDFYYWYYDDFDDFEEAEDWYYGHGGK